MILRLPRMAPHVARHLGALARLGARDAGAAVKDYGAAAVQLALAGGAAFFAVLMACAWLLAAVWDTDWRTFTAGMLTLAFAVPAVLLALRGRRLLAASQPFAATRRNLEADRRLYAEVRPDDAHDGREAPPPEPELQLEQSRTAIRRLLAKDRPASRRPSAGGVAAGAAAAGQGAGFPRSRTMQLLTARRGGTGALVAQLLQRGGARALRAGPRGRPGAGVH